ncbi:MAG: pyridoxal phosphate-dependent aminotransferase family protein [Segetibacter sp.]|nr:pyridoxal phosphate-dependent aminotransferase family protein [Segetibacter sp.]
MHLLNAAPGRTANVNGEDFLFFSGYAYLGLSHVNEFTALVKEGIDRYGVLHPSSRISNTRLTIYDELESKLSALTGQEDTVTFSSGFLSGRAVIETLFTDSIPCYTIPGSHPAIAANTKLLTWNWQQQLLDEVTQSNETAFILLLDSVNPLTAIVADLSLLENIRDNKKITCIIDDSHGIGLLGKQGEGISASLPQLTNVEYIITYSLSKALHINGGAVSCSKLLAERLRHSPYYTASTAIAPSLAYAFIHAESLYNTQREKLRHNIATLINLLAESSEVAYYPQLPFFIMHHNASLDGFTKNKIIISSFSYPDPTGKKINRLVVNALHSKEDLEIVAECLR